MPSSPAPRWSILALILAAASWGVGTVVSKRAVEEIPPLTLLPIQLATSLAVLALLMRWRGLPFRDPSAAPVLGRLGVLNPGIAYALSLIGLASISASLSVLLWASEPLLILFLAGWLLRERERGPVSACTAPGRGTNCSPTRRTPLADLSFARARSPRRGSAWLRGRGVPGRPGSHGTGAPRNHRRPAGGRARPAGAGGRVDASSTTVLRNSGSAPKGARGPARCLTTTVSRGTWRKPRSLLRARAPDVT